MCQLADFYPRSPCGERPSSTVIVILRKNFYPRSPCGERHNLTQGVFNLFAFLSTLSLRRATLAGPSGPAFLFNFYPRSPCGERQTRRASRQQPAGISIHALLAESDLINTYHRIFGEGISIHALLAESDSRKKKNNPANQTFLSTLSLRRATTWHSVEYSFGKSISIHALLAESDRNEKVKYTSTGLFLSTLSLRRATGFIPRGQLPAPFLSTLSLRRATDYYAVRC